MYCAVFGCNNNTLAGGQHSYFVFPKDKKLLVKWLLFCKRKDDLNPNVARICSDHFKEEDIINNMQFKMGFAKQRVLKKNAVPTLNFCDENSTRSLRMKQKNNKEMVKSILGDETNAIVNEFSQPSPFEVCEVPQNPEIKLENENEFDSLQFETEGKAEFNNLKSEVERLQKEKNYLKEKEKVFVKLILEQQTKIMKIEAENSNLKKGLKTIFTEGQIKKLCNGTKKQKWCEEDISRSIDLYSAGARTYRLLLRKQFPLPSIRSLQEWSQKAKIENGIPQI